MIVNPPTRRRPSWKAGYYPRSGRPKLPSVWNGLVGLWSPGLGASSDTLFDVSHGVRNSGAINGATWVVDGGRQALDFDGVDDYAIVADDPAIDLIDGSVSFWMLCRTRSDAEYMIAKKSSDSGSGANDLSYGIGWQSDKPRLLISDGGSFQVHSSTTTPSLSEWHHVSFTFNGATIQSYLDGSPDGSVAQTITPQNAAQSLLIGALTTGALRFDGLLDDIVLHNRALAAAEIRQLYQAGRGGITAMLEQTYGLSAAGGTAAVTGSITDTINEDDVTAGTSMQLISTLTGDTWVSAAGV